ncbi:MAG: GNAT family N-acetyltransferase [Acidimicrobiia bacterium]|nr:GNAT family N-acetyltransferase [Acidimicrobiia bacterium]
MDSERHALGRVLDSAAAGKFPEPDGSVTILPLGDTAAVLGFTMRHYILTDLAEDEVRDRLDPANFAAPMLPSFLAWFAERQGLEAGFSDIVLATVVPRGVTSTLEKADADAWIAHPRVSRAKHHRSNVELWTTPDRHQLAVIGSGVAGRSEISVEIAAQARNRGLAAGLIAEAVATQLPGTAIFAQVSPGNVASLRAFLAAGFRPICSEVIFAPLQGATVPA